MKQWTAPPRLSSTVLLMPARAICVSVTISQPGFERLDSFLHGVRGKDKIVRVVKVRGGVDGALDHKRIFRVQLAVSQKLGDDLEACALQCPWVSAAPAWRKDSFRQASRKRTAKVGLA